jgi:hypothetical protein
MFFKNPPSFALFLFGFSSAIVLCGIGRRGALWKWGRRLTRGSAAMFITSFCSYHAQSGFEKTQVLLKKPAGRLNAGFFTVFSGKTGFLKEGFFMENVHVRRSKSVKMQL